MSIRPILFVAAAAALVAGAIFVIRGPARAQLDVLMKCGSQYQSAREAEKLGDQSWREFFDRCRARVALATAVENAASAKTNAPPAVSAVPPVAIPTAATESAASIPTAPVEADAKAVSPEPAAVQLVQPNDRASERSRQKKCKAEWKSKKAELKNANPGLSWSQYKNECDERLRASGQ